MTLNEWTTQTKAKLQQIAAGVGSLTPSVSYYSLAMATVTPLVAAAAQGQVPYSEIFGLLSGLGGNLLANEIQQWKTRSEAEMEAELTAHVQHDPTWRDLCDTLLEKFDALRVVQAVLSEADQDELTRRIGTELQRQLQVIGSRLVISGDWGMGDQVDGDKITAGAITGNVGVAMGRGITQIINNYNGPADKTPELYQRYLHRLRQRCHVLPLEAMGGEGSVSEGVTLDKVYVTLNTRTTIPLTEAEKAERKKAGAKLREDEQKPLTALAAATEYKRLVLLGDPGSGKSTFVQQLAADVAGAALGRTPLPGWSPHLFPIITLLRDLAPRLNALDLAGLPAARRNDALSEAILQLWQADLANLKCADLADLLENRLDAGALCLIFDGLDEVPPPSRGLVRSALLALLQRYPQIERVVVTCRVRSYQGEAVLPHFDPHTLAPFTEEQIGNFIAGWYQAQMDLGRLKDRASQQAKTADLQEAALAPSLRELAENPMLLTTMAMIHQQEIRLPPQRVQLYKLAVNVLLQRWQNSKGVALSPALEALLRDEVKLRDCVERIGYESLRVRLATEQSQHRPLRGEEEAEDEAGDLRRADLLTLLDDPRYLGDSGLAQEFLDYVDQRAGLLVGRGGGDATGRKPPSYRFPHRTFQEYLAGCYLVSARSVERAYEERAAEGDRWELAALLGGEELLFNRANRAKLLDLIYYLCGPSAPRNKTQWRRLLWAAQLATVVERVWIEQDQHKDGGLKFLRRLSEQLLLAVGAKSPLLGSERATAGNALARLGDPRPGVGVKNGLPDLAWSQVIPPGPFLMGDKESWEGGQRFTCTLITQPYRISRYPITVVQYRPFVVAGGYQQPKYWTKAGWAWREEEQIDGPRRLGGIFELDNHPQVGVSWYEAVAYCRWLVEQTNQPVRLPSEAEWERAARVPSTPELVEGVDGANLPTARIYPWGDEWNQELCNNVYLNINATTTVGIFPGGNAACGAADLSGNVWEWCSTQWLGNYQQYQQKADDKLEGTRGRVLRGGSFASSEYHVRCACRYYDHPAFRDGDLGFRVVLPGSGSLISEDSDL